MPQRTLALARPRARRLPARRLILGALAAGAALAPVALVTAGPALAATPTAPPPLTVLSSHGAIGRGDDIFITPTGDTAAYANGPEILDRNGNVVWFHAIPAADTAADFRVQRYDGRPVLTWWQGTGLGGLSQGTDYIDNDRFQPVATVNAGNGLSADGHEFLITPQNTALILAYKEETANLTAIGGPADQDVIDGIVQEIDIRTGAVLFQWDAADHVPYSQSEQPLPASSSTPWDWFHINAVHIDTDGNLLVDARDTWTTYKVNRHTGRIIWQLGGKASSFALRAAPGQSLNNAGDIFAWQHDPEAIGHDEYTFFDNESAGIANTGVGSTAEFGLSRVVRVRLDERDRTATLVASDDQPEGLTASSQGNGQSLPGGGEFVGWGILNDISQFDGAGNLVFNAEFPTGVNTYRAYLLPWAQRQTPWGPWAHHRGHRG
ncbi:MAG TPA: arylsulfotransferase family protein [Solirubrobacteraceae bacterium]|jgi:hypothetical protein|nr:arylsulfotransferase family protein [Solirubrobacteraceae bacterium]